MKLSLSAPNINTRRDADYVLQMRLTFEIPASELRNIENLALYLATTSRKDARS